MNKLFGPSFYGQNTRLKNIAQLYAISVLEANDKDRIKHLGMRHLKLASNKMLDGKQISLFLSHVIQYERCLNSNNAD